jgi:hypothetical protein
MRPALLSAEPAVPGAHARLRTRLRCRAALAGARSAAHASGWHAAGRPPRAPAQRRSTAPAAAFSRLTDALLEGLDARQPVQPDPELINADVAPVSPSARTFSLWDMAALWIGLVVCVPTYTLVGSLVELGFSAAQGLAIIAVRRTGSAARLSARAPQRGPLSLARRCRLQTASCWCPWC